MAWIEWIVAILALPLLLAKIVLRLLLDLTSFLWIFLHFVRTYSLVNFIWVYGCERICSILLCKPILVLSFICLNIFYIVLKFLIICEFVWLIIICFIFSFNIFIELIQTIFFCNLKQLLQFRVPLIRFWKVSMIIFLKSKTPIIVLGTKHRYLHYITWVLEIFSLRFLAFRFFRFIEDFGIRHWTRVIRIVRLEIIPISTKIINFIHNFLHIGIWLMIEIKVKLTHNF